MRELGASPSHRMTQGNLACPLGNGEVRPAPRGCPAQRAPRNEKRLSPRCLAQTPGTKPLLNDNDKVINFFLYHHVTTHDSISILSQGTLRPRKGVAEGGEPLPSTLPLRLL